MRSAFRFCLILLAACFVGLPAPASAIVVHSSASVSSSKLAAPVAVASVRSEKAPASAPNTMPFTLTAFAGIIGATKARKMDLSRTYIFNGEHFGPGEDIEVPEGFPDIDGETGNVIHEPGSTAARNAAASARANGTAPVQSSGLSAGTDAGTGTGTTVSGKSSEELETMSKSDLVTLADKSGVTVTREDGSDGEPLKADYVRVLGATAR